MRFYRFGKRKRFAASISHVLRHEHFSRFRHILPELARRIHLPPEHIRVSELEYPSVPETDAHMDLVLRFLVRIEYHSSLVHFDSSLDGVFGIGKYHQQTVSLELENLPAFLLDNGSEYKLRTVNGLQEVDNPELLDSSGEPGEIREHHCPLFPEGVPNPLVDLGGTIPRLHPLLNKRMELLSRRGFEDGIVVEHRR